MGPRVARLLAAVAALGATAGFAASGAASADYPGVNKRVPANPNTYVVADRPHSGGFIDSIMIHDTEATYPGTINAFTNPNATGSVQYAVSGQHNSNPAVTQFVPDKDWTFSVANFWFNQYSIGVEHIGFAAAPAGYYTQLLYQRSADLVGWVAWKYRIPIDRAHILGHDNIPTSVEQVMGTPIMQTQHWDPGPAWDWPYYMNLVSEAYARWSDDAAPPTPEIPSRYRKSSPAIREISIGDDFASAADVTSWTTGFHNAFTNVYANRDGKPALNTLVRGASNPSTYVPNPTISNDPTPLSYNKLDFSCDNWPWSIIPGTPPVLSSVAIGDLRAKAAWGEEFALVGRKRVQGVLYDRINFSGTTGWIRDSDTSNGWGALVRFRGGSEPTTLYSAPEYPGYSPAATTPKDTRICSDTQYGFSRAGQTYVAQIKRFSQGRTWYQIDYNHRVAWVPANELKVSAPTSSAPTKGLG
jgi:N-acetyl-anhydromuramyl-L-alanine amidase AmpD